MKQEALAHYKDIYLVGVAFFLFLFAFIAIVIQTTRKSQKEKYEKIAMLPMGEV